VTGRAAAPPVGAMDVEAVEVDAVVVGAGVVGLAAARRLALAGLETVVLEAENVIGSGVSARNSEVIHAGLYYPAGSLKARLCARGRRQLYAYCADHGVDHRRPGKLVVAADPGQLPRLEAVAAHARANGVDDLEVLSAAAAREMEPALSCAGALWSPSTGIVDSHALMLALRGDAEAAGAMVAVATPSVGGEIIAGGGFIVETGGAQPMRLRCRRLINSAGLSAWEVARRLRGLPATAIPPRYLARGNYFALSGVRAPFSRLIYPVPEDGGLGVHLTLDLAGQARFGPDVEWLDGAAEQLSYRVDPARGDGFYAAIRRYWPGLPDGALVPAYAGVRPKLSGPGDPAADFMIAGPDQHGVAGLALLFGIESPGLTASLAIADEVARVFCLDQ
jgi:L-2-hydroxyglutarate oxidase LhgO